MGWICDFCGTENCNTDKCCKVCDAPAPQCACDDLPDDKNDVGLLVEDCTDSKYAHGSNSQNDVGNLETDAFGNIPESSKGGKQNRGNSMIWLIGIALITLIGFIVFLNLFEDNKKAILANVETDSIEEVDASLEEEIVKNDESSTDSSILPKNSSVILVKYASLSDKNIIYYVSESGEFRKSLYIYDGRVNSTIKLVEGSPYVKGCASPDNKFVYFVVDVMANSNRNYTFVIYQVNTMSNTIKIITSGAGFRNDLNGFQVAHAFLLNPNEGTMAKREYEFIDTYYDFNGKEIAMGKKYSYDGLAKRYGKSLHELGESGSTPSYVYKGNYQPLSIYYDGEQWYENARYGYTIYYPSVMTPLGEPENGDGQAFSYNDIVFRVSACYDSFRYEEEGFTRGTKQYMEWLVHSHYPDYSYMFVDNNCYVVSREKQGYVQYNKSILVENSDDDDEDSWIWVNLQLEYPKNKQQFVDPFIKTISKCNPTSLYPI